MHLNTRIDQTFPSRLRTASFNSSANNLTADVIGLPAGSASDNDRKSDGFEKDRKFYRVGEVWGTESECELTRRCSIERIVRAPGGVVV